MKNQTNLLKFWGFFLILMGIVSNIFFWLKIVFKAFTQEALIITVCMMVAGLVNIIYAKQIAKNDKIPPKRKQFLSFTICLMQGFIMVFAFIKLREAGGI